MKKRKTELERTCKRCATVWYAWKETKPNQWEIAGAKMSASGSRMTLGGGRRGSQLPDAGADAGTAARPDRGG